jgi:HAE1 family hydrophobic/amphiphilic exporter-1
VKLSELGVAKPVTTTMIFLAILVFGFVSLYLLPLDLMPEIEPPAISVITAWTGASTEDVETKVTRVIENNLSIINNLDKINSTTREGLSSVTCQFNWGTDLDEAANDIRDRLEFAKRVLPDDVETPFVFKFNSSLMPVLFVSITCSESWEKLEKIINDDLADPLKRLPGVGAVQTIGAPHRQINVLLNRKNLAAYGLTLLDVETALRGENLTLPAGSMKIGAVDYTIRVPGEYERPDQIPDIPIKRVGSKIIYMRDVARVIDGFEEETRLVEALDRPGMVLLVQKRSGANTVQVCESVLKEMERLKENLPRDIQINVIQNSSGFIRDSINNVSSTVLWGGLFVVLTSFIFLRSLRTSLVIALTIPFSLIISFAFMFLMGWTLNVLSLAALAIAIGMVVDNAVVVLENITSHVDRGEKVREASIFGSEEVGLAISASTYTTIVVFLPLIFVKGIVGIFFTQLGGIVTVTLMASLLCALLLTPMLCSKLLQPPAVRKAAMRPASRRILETSENAFLAVEEAYGRLLAWSLGHRPAVLLAIFAAFCASLLLIPIIGTEFTPEQDSGDLTLTVQLPVSTRVETTAATMRRITALSRELAEPGAVRLYAWRCGTAKNSYFGSSEGTHIGRLSFKLIPAPQRKQSSKELGNAIANRLRQWPEVTKLAVDTGDQMGQMLMGGGGKPIVVEILGHDLDATDRIAQEIKALAETIPGARDVTVSRDNGNQELAVRVDREKAAALGVPVATVVESLRTLYAGKTATAYREAEEEYDVYMQLEESERASIQDLLNTEIALADGRRIRLDALATVAEERGPVTIERKDQERLVKVEMAFETRTMGEVANDLKEAISKKVALPSGVGITYGGLVEEQQKSFKDLFLLLVLGIVLVYMVMAAQFESFLDPFIVMFAVPFGFTGVLLLLFLTHTAISLMSLIGMILLVGTVVNNAIVLIDYINILRARGQSMLEAVRNSGRQRLRPVLITSLTTIFGMMPLAVSRGVGSESWRPLAITVIGGLAVSTLVTLVLVPVVYSLFKRKAA